MAKSEKKTKVSGKFFGSVKLFNKDKRKIKTLVNGINFELFIMSIILADAAVLGMMTFDWISVRFDRGLFLLDRLFMGIFIVEMLLKIYAYGKDFFKSRWNIFDFVIVAVSSIPFASALIVFRTFRLFRLLKYINRCVRLKNIINIFTELLPTFISMLAVLGVFFYVFAIISVNLYGDIFEEFSSLGLALFTLVQIFTLDGWASEIARPVMDMYPHSWIFFTSFIFSSLGVVLGFSMGALVQTMNKFVQK